MAAAKKTSAKKPAPKKATAAKKVAPKRVPARKAAPKKAAPKATTSAIGPWRKSPPELIARFEQVIAELPGVEPRKMFGYPAAFVNGNMFAGLWQEETVVRIGEAAVAAGVKSGDVTQFEPMGRPMKAYAMLGARARDDANTMGQWIARALTFAGALPAKVPAPKKARG